MSRVLDLIAALAGNASTKDATAQNTPALDDNTKKLATTEFLRQQFAGTGKQLINQSGYQKFPGGLIIQWGQRTTPIPATSGAAFAFPIAFPTACLHAQISFVNTQVFSPGNGNPNQIYFIDQTQIGIYNGGSEPAEFMWLAIGH